MDFKTLFSTFHRFDLDDPKNSEYFVELLHNPALVGLTEEDFVGKNESQRNQMIIGEYFAQVSDHLGKVAGELLFNVQWGGRESEWFDHRLHLLDPEKWFTDYWSASADNVIKVLPRQGKMLNLCSGDGFYDFYYYRKRAGEIVCVELDREPLRHARRVHSAPNITYLNANVLTYEPPAGAFDVVVIRGAIEHFSQEHQHVIFAKAARALKKGGWFCGDTPARKDDNNKHLSMHKYEWADEIEMRKELVQHFDHVETSTLVSDDLTNLFWRCKKTRD